jgi:hypothetical protein
MYRSATGSGMYYFLKYFISFLSRKCSNSCSRNRIVIRDGTRRVVLNEEMLIFRQALQYYKVKLKISENKEFGGLWYITARGW